MQERENGGAFMGLEDFCSRMYGTDLNKRAMENLIKCGACDCFGLKRSQLLAIYDAVMESVAASRRNNVEGQMGLFGMMEGDDAPISDIHVPDLPELSAQERMSMERETTGLYLSGHPMDDYREQLKGTGVVPIGRILQSLEEHDDVYQDEQVVSIAGIVQTAKMKTTRNQSLMAYVTLEDNTGSMELMLFSSTLKQYGGQSTRARPSSSTGASPSARTRIRRWWSTASGPSAICRLRSRTPRRSIIRSISASRGPGRRASRSCCRS